MMATPPPTSSKKHSLSLSPPSVRERAGSFCPKVLASESKAVDDVNRIEGQKVKPVGAYNNKVLR